MSSDGRCGTLCSVAEARAAVQPRRAWPTTSIGLIAVAAAAVATAVGDASPSGAPVIDVIWRAVFAALVVVAAVRASPLTRLLASGILVVAAGAAWPAAIGGVALVVTFLEIWQ